MKELLYVLLLINPKDFMNTKLAASYQALAASLLDNVAYVQGIWDQLGKDGQYYDQAKE